MPFTRFQGVADETEVIPSEFIDDFIAGYEFEVPVGLAVAWARPSGRGNVPVSYPRWDAMADGVPAAKAETDEFAERDIAMSESSITPALRGFVIHRSDEAAAASPNGVEAGLVMEAIRNCLDAMDVSTLASIASITANTGAVGDTYNLARFRADLAAYKLLNVARGPLGTVAVISGGMADDLLTDLHSSQATLVTGRGDSLALGPDSGFLGSLHSVGIYETTNLPASTTGRAGAMMPGGNMASPLGVVVNEQPRVETTRGDNSARRASTQHVFRYWIGTGVTNPRKGIQILGPT